MPECMSGLWCRFMAAENFPPDSLSAAPYQVRITEVPDTHLYEADAWAREYAGVYGQTWFRETSPMFTFRLDTDEFFFSSVFAFDNALVAFEFKLRFG